MDVKWLLETDTFEEDLEPIKDEIKRQGMEYTMVDYIPFGKGKYDQYPDDACVIFYGSLNLGAQLYKQKQWVPGVWCNLKNFECTTYYAHFGKHLLNDLYWMMPRSELNRRKDEFFEMFDGKFFARPSTGFKSFTGQVFTHDHFERDWEWADDFALAEDIVVVSSPKEIFNEFRFVCADKKIVSGTRYKLNGDAEPLPLDQCDKATVEYATEFAQRVASEEWEPEPIYTIDVGELDNSCGRTMRLMEINSFSCSGLYNCDPEPIVKAARELAIKEYQDLSP